MSAPRSMTPEVSPMLQQSTCSAQQCERPHHARGWCQAHYSRIRWRQREPVVRPALPTIAERLWSKALADGTGCWIWQGSKSGGYGALRVGGRGVHGGRMLRAHRIAYELVKGPIPKGLTIDHLCRVRACINPDHMEPVTMTENTLRGRGITSRHARGLLAPEPPGDGA